MKVWQKIVAIIALIGLFGTAGFTVLKGWTESGKGSAKNITLGLDLNGGVSVTYQAVGKVSSQDMDDVAYKMTKRVDSMGYDGAQVYKEGGDRVTIEIPGADDAQAILSELGKPGSLYFILECIEKTDATSTDSTEKATDATSETTAAAETTAATEKAAVAETTEASDEKATTAETATSTETTETTNTTETTDKEDSNYITNFQSGYTIDDAGNLTYATVLVRDLEDLQKDGSIVMTGEDIKSAEAVYISTDSDSRKPVMQFTLTDEGAKKFENATRIASTHSWTIGIYYDGEFISVPSVEKVIDGGSGYINSESWTDLTEAKKLASNIRIGALPVELEEISSQVVGATLGKEAISTSVKAGIVGFALLFIFMIAYYRIPGIAANLALVAYTLGMLLVLNVYNFTLTLPGIAGIILGIGMAVDANVIINARIREEIARGVSVRSAISIGYKKALSAIVDGNVTTLIAAIVLGIIGTGPVRGFALTLGIGIVLSMITSLLVSRWVMLLLYNCGCKKEGMYGADKERKSIDFLSKRKLFLSISGLIIATGIAFLAVHGAKGDGIFNFDLEFSGGTTTSVTFNESHSVDEIEDTIIPQIKEVTGVSTVQQQTVRDSNTVNFKTKWLSDEQQKAFYTMLSEKYNIDTTNADVVSSERISATISSEMRRDAVIAVVVATICMLIYIWIRFRDVKFATSAIIALLHDVLVVLAFYAISRTSVGNTFIACMLTIVGYSINATIVIFDRVRENLKSMSKSTVGEVVNNSITSTLSRSINTSLTTFIMVLVLYIMGVSSIREFAAPIMVGIVAGGYSSVCVTGALWYIMKKASYKRAVKKAN